MVAVRRKKNRYSTVKVSRKGFIRGILKTIVGGIICSALVILLSAALGHGYHAFLNSAWFAVDDVQVKGLKHVTRDEILNVMKVPRGASLLNLKMGQLAQRVERLSWVKMAVVRWDPPGRLTVEVTEREPLAVVLAEAPYLVDLEGRVFLKVERDRYPELIALHGLSDLDLKEGEYLPLEPFETLRELKVSVEKYEALGKDHRVSEYYWDAVEGISLHLKERAVAVHLGSEGFDNKIERLKRILKLLEERQWLDVVSHIDLDFPNRAFVEGNFPPSKNQEKEAKAQL